MSKNKISRNKKGLSVIIGYILLVSFVIIMGTIVYKWMSTYVPKDAMDCPDEVSLFVNDVTFDCGTHVLTIGLQNNGRFNVDGYFIRATNDSTNQELATIELSKFFDKDSSTALSAYVNGSNLITFSSHEKNSFKPGDSATHVFNLMWDINSIEIVPERSQLTDNRNRVVSCGGSKIREIITCS